MIQQKKKKEVKHNLFVCSNIIFPQTLPTSYTLFYVKYFLFDKKCTVTAIQVLLFCYCGTAAPSVFLY